MGYNYTYGNNLLGSSASSGLFSLIWTIVAFVLALVGCFVVYFLFVKKNVDSKNKFVLWLQEFLRFNKMLIEPIIKISYIFGAIFLTLGSFALIPTSFVSFLVALVVGNLVLRVAYEASIMLVMLWKNTSEINKKLK